MQLVALQSPPIEGPPWYQQILLFVIGLAILVLGLIAVLLYLWIKRPEPDLSFSVNNGDSDDELSEYDRIKQLCSASDGKLPQQEVVKRTDWSEAKVSRIISRLADEGQIEKTRIGRQNFIQLGDTEENEFESDNSEHAQSEEL